MMMSQQMLTLSDVTVTVEHVQRRKLGHPYTDTNMTLKFCKRLFEYFDYKYYVFSGAISFLVLHIYVV